MWCVEEDCLRSCNDLTAQTHCCPSSAVSTTICKPLFATMALPRKHSQVHVALNRDAFSHQPYLQFISQHFCFVPFHPLPVFCSTHVTLGSCLIHLASEPALRLVRCLYVNCSMPTMRPLLPTVLQMRKRCVILSQQRALTLE